MARWFKHDECLFNLDLYKQICCGDNNEILLSDYSRNEEWEDEEKLCSLIFIDSEVRDIAFEEIKKLLELPNG